MRLKIIPVLTLLLLSALAANVAAQETYEVTVTNILRGQPLAPPLVVAHDNNFTLFTPGKKALRQLGTLAETGNPMPLAERIDGKKGVIAIATGDHITKPGESITLTITAEEGSLLTVATMLGATNDAFASVQGVALTDGAVYWAPAWDAGTEENTEAIGDVGALGGGNARRTINAEKRVHIHSGIFGKADQDPGVYDWRNPVAMITVKKVN